MDKFIGNCRYLLSIVLTVLLTHFGAPQAFSDLSAVSGRPAADPNRLTGINAAGNPGDAAVSLATGFPIWYDDGTPLKLQLCLDSRVEVAPGIFVNPCEFAPPSPAAPVSFPDNFGPEALYWAGASFGTFTSSSGFPGSALLVLALEAGFANEGPITDGNQAVFSRIRLRIDAPVAGTYRVTHPFGTRDYIVTIPGIRAINQTQDIGISRGQNFLSALSGEAPVVPAPFNPSVNAGIVNGDGAAVGPFLLPAAAHGGVFDPAVPATFAGGPITALNGAGYIGLPFAPDPANPNLEIEVFQPVSGSPFLTNGAPSDFFTIELLDPPGGFFLNAADSSQTVRFDDFQMIGKIFDDGLNAPPAAPAEITAGTGANRPISIDVLPAGEAAALDPIGPGNAHGVDPQAIAVADANGPILNAAGMPVLSGTLPTAAGGSVRRVTALPTGKSTFLYTPPAAFTGEDSFRFVVQDTGGLISDPGLVTITVENLTVDLADFRVKTGKWTIRGTSSDVTANTVTLYGGPQAFLTGASVLPPKAGASVGNAALRVQANAIEFRFSVSPLPASPVREASLHVGGPNENGPVLFFLYFDFFDGPFGGEMSGLLTSTDLFRWPEAGISTFSDAVTAIRDGRAYITVGTAANPSGEIRGRIERPVIAETPVKADGTWEYRSKATAGPGVLPSVSATSANRVETPDVRLRLR